MSAGTRALFQCDGAQVPREFARASWSTEFPLLSAGSDQNMSLMGFNDTPSAASALTGRAHDLVRIAAYAYVADQAISRGGYRDEHHVGWRRTMALCVPVSDPDFWSQEDIRAALERALRFATDDMWTFAFARRPRHEPDQLSLFDELGDDGGPSDPADQVLLLSGGADSLCAAVQAITAGRRPHLVSHRPSLAHDARQHAICNTVGYRFGAGVLARTRFPIHLVAWEAKDSSQRSRAFLFASLGASVAHAVRAAEVVLADNGVVSVALALHKGLPGALMSRTTHPRFLEYFNELLALVLPGIRVTNPLQKYTRGQTLSILSDGGCPDLLRMTNSCSRARNTGGRAGHCGYCSQCVDRRFGVIRAGIEAHEPPDQYFLDVFTRRLDAGEKQTIPVTFVNRAKKIESLDDDGLFREFPQLYDCLPLDPRSGRSATSELITLLRRHAAEVHDVMQTMSGRYWDGLYRDAGDGPDDVAQNSLLRLVFGNVAPSAASGSEAPPQNGRPTFADDPPRPSTDRIFRREGDGWLVAFDGQTAHIRDLDGMFYLAQLLANPYQDVRAMELYGLIGSTGATPGANGVSLSELEEMGLTKPKPALRTPKMDEPERRRARDRLLQIAAELDRADEIGDQATSIALDEEARMLTAVLQGTSGRPGEVGTFGTDEEKVRDAVRSAIRRAITCIGRRHPMLARHLKDTIHSGFRCTYTPRSQVRWVVATS